MMKSVGDYNNAYSPVHISSSFDISLTGAEFQPSKELLADFDFDKACDTIQVMKAFRDGDLLDYPAIWGIATNVVHIRGGGAWFSKHMAGTPNERDNTKLCLHYARKRREEDGYLPQRLENFSPFEADHEYLNILVAGKPAHTVIRLDEYNPGNFMTVQEVEQRFKAEFEEALLDHRCHVFKVPTGFGKTQALLNITHPCVLAFPTPALKDEVLSRMQSVGRNPKRTLPIPEDLDKADKELIAYLYRVGCYSQGVLI